MASRKTVIAVPSPSALMRTMSAATKERLTSTTIAAALVMIRPERSNPRITLDHAGDGICARVVRFLDA